MMRKKQLPKENAESANVASKSSSCLTMWQLNFFMLGCLLLVSAVMVFKRVENMPSMEHHPYHMAVRTDEPGHSSFLQLEVASARTNTLEKLSSLPLQETATPPPGVQPVALDATKPVPPHSIPNSSTPIHLVISAFRDGPRCARTLGYALMKARNPERIFFEVMQALNLTKGDISCESEFKKNQLKTFCRKRPDMASCEKSVLQRFKVWIIPLDHGMGPAHQRGLLNQERTFDSSDAMCMTTDSHMDFLLGWDNVTSQEWLKANNEFGVLSAYPFGVTNNQDEVFANSYVDLCGYTIEEGVPRGKTGVFRYRKEGAKPYFTMNWAAGFSFHRCHADRNVPVDVNLKWIFTGEEVDRAVRLWTHGYDIYLPQVTTVYHDYSHAHQDFWQFADAQQQQKDRENSRMRLGTLLGIPELATESGEATLVEKKQDLGRFGLGTQRTLEQFVEWSHFDMGSQRWTSYLGSKNLKAVNEHSKGYDISFCSELKYVPVKDMTDLWTSAFNGDPLYLHATPPVTVL